MDNNTCFYVGKGNGKRAYYTPRNEHHDRVAKKYGMEVKILAENLSESDAYELERYTIMNYVVNLGYGIDIDGYRKNDGSPCLTNCTFGGDGSYGMVHSESWCKQHSEDMSGENNPMYGVNVWDMYSEEKAKEVKRKIGQASAGNNNPMYGISPSDRMSDAKYREWLHKTRKRLSLQTGSNNPNSREVFVYDRDNNYIDHFDYIGSCCEWLRDTLKITTKINGMRSEISKSMKSGKLYRGFHFYDHKI